MGGLTQGSRSDAGTSDSPYPTADELPGLGLTYFDLQRRVRVDEALWETLTKQYEAAKVEEAEEIPTVQLLDAANVPLKKSSPSRRLIVEVGAVMSFVLAFIVIIATTMWKEADPEGEPKRLMTEVAGSVMESHRWYWSIPGLRWLRTRLMRSQKSYSPFSHSAG
jgi:hypothetical protein